jgi:parvulin-like peptidyl-prolyl isomerase
MEVKIDNLTAGGFMKQFFAFILIISAVWSCSRAPENVLFTFGDESYGLQELHSFYNPEYIKKIDEESQKERMQNYFYTVISNRVMDDSSLWNDDELQTRLDKEYHRKLLRELYEKKVTDYVLSEDKLRTLYQRGGRELHVSHLLISHEEAARSSSKRSKKDALTLIQKIAATTTPDNFWNVARTYTDDASSRNDGGDLGWIQAGQMVPEFDDMTFSLNPGEISQPFQTMYGFHIVYLKEERPNPQKEFSEMKEELQTRASQIYGQQVKDRAASFLDSVQNSQPLVFDDKVLNAFFDLYMNKTIALNAEKSPSAIVKSLAFSDIIASNENDWIDKHWLSRYLSFYDQQPLQFRSADELKKFIESNYGYDLLQKLAINEKLDQDSLFTLEMKRLRMNAGHHHYVTKYIIDRINPTKGQRIAFYEKNKDRLYKIDEQIQVIEILVSDSLFAESLLDSIQQGADISYLATKYTERKYAQSRKGILPFFKKGRYGKMGDAAFQLNLGELAGPIPISNKYSIIKLIEKKPVSYRHFDEVEGKLLTDYKRLMKKELVDEHFEKLAKKYNAVYNPTFASWYRENVD